MTEQRRQLVVRYDFEYDVLTVQGIRYAADSFRLVHAAQVGALFELAAREDGVLTLHVLTPDKVSKTDVIDKPAQIIIEHEPST